MDDVLFLAMTVWTVCLYCNFLCVRIVFSLFSNGLDGKHMDRHVVLLSRRKINLEERLPSSLCTPPSALRYQEKFRPVTQHRQGSSMHTNTFMSPPSAPATHAPGLVLWGRRWGMDGSLSYVIREAGTESGWPIHNRNMHSGSHSSYFRLQLGHSFDWHIWPSLSVCFFFTYSFPSPADKRSPTESEVESLFVEILQYSMQTLSPPRWLNCWLWVAPVRMGSEVQLAFTVVNYNKLIPLRLSVEFSLTLAVLMMATADNGDDSLKVYHTHRCLQIFVVRMQTFD